MPVAQSQEWNKKVGQITAKAWTDADFKKRLLTDPVAVLKENGLDVPSDVKLKVVEDTDTLCHLTLPLKPGGKELSEEDLAGMAGGIQRTHRCVKTGL